MAQQLQEKEIELARQRNARDAVAAKIAGEMATISALQGKTAMPEPEAQRSMRRALNDAGISHAMLSDIVEVTDPRWQGAVEGVLGGYASVVLLDKAGDATSAYRLAEKERYRHFIVPDLVHARRSRRQPDVGGEVLGQGAAWLWSSFRASRAWTRRCRAKLGTTRVDHAGRLSPRTRGGRSLFVEAAALTASVPPPPHAADEAIQRSLPRWRRRKTR